MNLRSPLDPTLASGYTPRNLTTSTLLSFFNRVIADAITNQPGSILVPNWNS